MREKTVKDLEIKKIAVFRALHLGDLLAVIPSIRALRKNFPYAEITLIGLPWAMEFSHRFREDFDEFIEFPGFPGLPERRFNADAFARFLLTVQKENFDLAIQMQGSGDISNRLIELFGAKNIAGFYKEGSYQPRKGFFAEYPEGGHEGGKFLKLMEAIGIKASGTNPEFPVFEAEAVEAERLLTKNNLQEREFVCVHVGSREDARRWDLDNFAKTADFISALGYKVVFTGTEKEREYVHKVIKKVKSPSVNLTGCTALGELAEILRKSALLISNDTGVVHIAAAIGAESVVIYTKEGSNLERWAPLDRKKHSIIEPESAKQIDHVLEEINLRLRAESPVPQSEEGLQSMKGENEHARAI